MYAKLKALGMTSFQLKKIIYLQGNILSIIFIPIGIISSCIITYIIQPLAWQMTTDLFIILVLSIVIFLTVRISLNKPARIISKLPLLKLCNTQKLNLEIKLKHLII